MIFYAVDPGTTTGFAWLVDGHFGSGMIRGRYEAITAVANAIEQYHPAEGLTVIIERWDVRANTHRLTNQDDPRYIIGAIDWLCHSTGVRYVEQTPAQAKRFGDDIKLKRLGWYRPGEGHDNDAARHLLTFLAKHPGPAGDEIREALTR